MALLDALLEKLQQSAQTKSPPPQAIKVGVVRIRPPDLENMAAAHKAGQDHPTGDSEDEDTLEDLADGGADEAAEGEGDEGDEGSCPICDEHHPPVDVPPQIAALVAHLVAEEVAKQLEHQQT